MREHFDSKNMQFVDKSSKNSKKTDRKSKSKLRIVWIERISRRNWKIGRGTPPKTTKTQEKANLAKSNFKFRISKKNHLCPPPHRTPILFWRNIKRWKYHQTPWWERHLVRKEHFLPHSSDIVIIAFVLVCIDLDAERAWMWRAMWPPEQTPTRIRPLLH